MKLKPMKIGDRFWVVDYYAHQKEPAIFQVSKLYPKGWPEVPEVRYEAFDIANPKSSDGFGDHGSPNVWSARIIRTKRELTVYKARRLAKKIRKRIARYIYPEGEF